MKSRFILTPASLLLLLLIFISGCHVKLPEVSTNPVSEISSLSAVSGGIIVSEGNTEIIYTGICWDTIPGPVATCKTWLDNSVNTEFKAPVTGLLPDTRYFVRAFAITPDGASYGNEVSFRTVPSVPVLSTSEVYEITTTTAGTGGRIYSDGGYDIIEYGICLDTLPSPTIEKLRSPVGDNTLDFTLKITGLLPDRKYYLRAYAVNSLGTSYGEEREFRTKKYIPLTAVFTITERYLYSSSVNVRSVTREGKPVTSYGVCWNTKPDPKIDNFSKTRQYARGRFRLRDLKPGTKYYVRLFSIDEDGIHYSKEGTFTSLGKGPVAETMYAFDLTETGAKLRARINNGFLPTNVIFEYGSNNAYGQSQSVSLPLGGGGRDTVVTVAVDDLKPGTPYSFRVKASNILGIAHGRDTAFVVLITPELKGFNPITRNYSDTAFYLTPPISNSPGDFIYSSSDSSIAVIEGNRVRITGSGTCIITAIQQPSGKFASGSITTTFSMNLVDIDGNVYETVRIGDQDWMKENLRVTRYRNGQPIRNVTDDRQWITLKEGAYCWMKNDTSYRNTKYGALYNWYAVSDPRRICPAGWHVPTDAEWQVMERFLGMTFDEAEGTTERGTDQGVQLKDSTGWVKDGNGTNSSEFSGLPAGLRISESGEFYNIGADACWWTNTSEDDQNAWIRNMYYYFNSIYRIPDLKISGFSVRCVRDRRRD